MPSTEGWWYYFWWVWDLRIPILATKFSIKLTILTFSTKLAQKKRFWSKKQKVNTAIEFCIIELVYVSSFILNCKYWQFGQKLPKRTFPVENEKSQKHHWIQHIRISLGINFHLKLTISTFWTKSAQKGHFWSKSKKVNTAIEFCIFELV